MADITGDNSIDSLLAGANYRWNVGSDYGSAVTVTYSFMTAAPSYASQSDSAGFAAMSTSEQAAVESALALWAAVANVSFTEVSDSGDGGKIRFGTNRQRGSAAYSYYPASAGWGGDVYLNNQAQSNDDLTTGSYGFLTVIHEIGHALGLKHPGDYDGTGSEEPYLPSSTDNYDYSVMSYYDGSGLYPATLMLYDIAAIQYLYGANMSWATGNDSYVASTVYSQCIWDAGGWDAIDAGAVTRAVTIDLNAGSFSSIGATNNLSIAYNVTIEGASGGSGNDRIVGNGSANVLDGQLGNDTLVGGEGDTLYGRAGTDTAELTGGAVSLSEVESVAGSTGSDTVTLLSVGNTLAVSAVEAVVGSAGSDFLTLGNSGNTLVLSGVDILLGGSGRDVASLSSGADSVVTALVEVLDGGAGNDLVTLGNRGVTMTVNNVETVAGGVNSDFITLGDSGNAVTVTAVEIVLGGAGSDVVALGDSAGSTVTLAAVETVIGWTGSDQLHLGNRGVTLTIGNIENVVGGTGQDFVTLGYSTTSLYLSGVEILLGNTGSDLVMLGGGGNTVIAAEVETIVGGAGNDALILGNRGVTLTVFAVESVTGGSGADSITLFGTGSATSIGFTALSVSGTDQIVGFEASTDHIAITGTLLSAVDKSGNGQLGVTQRASGAVVGGSDEMVVLTTQVSGSLTADTSFTAFRSALGAVTSGSTATTLVLANNGSDTGLYAVTDNGDGIIAAAEVTLLGVFSGAVLGAAAMG